MLPIPALRAKAVQKLPEFLAHRYPKVRPNTQDSLRAVPHCGDVDKG